MIGGVSRRFAAVGAVVVVVGAPPSAPGCVRAREGAAKTKDRTPCPQAVPGGRRAWWVSWRVGELRCAWVGRWYVLWSHLAGRNARAVQVQAGAVAVARTHGRGVN